MLWRILVTVVFLFHTVLAAVPVRAQQLPEQQPSLEQQQNSPDILLSPTGNTIYDLHRVAQTTDQLTSPQNPNLFGTNPINIGEPIRQIIEHIVKGLIKSFLYVKIYLPTQLFTRAVSGMITHVFLPSVYQSRESLKSMLSIMLTIGLPTDPDNFEGIIGDAVRVLSSTSRDIATGIWVISLMVLVILIMVAQLSNVSYSISEGLQQIIIWLFIVLISANAFTLIGEVNKTVNSLVASFCTSRDVGYYTLSQTSASGGLCVNPDSYVNAMTPNVLTDGPVTFMVGFVIIIATIVVVFLAYAGIIIVTALVYVLSPIAIAFLALRGGVVVFNLWLNTYVRAILMFIGVYLALAISHQIHLTASNDKIGQIAIGFVVIALAGVFAVAMVAQSFGSVISTVTSSVNVGMSNINSIGQSIASMPSNMLNSISKIGSGFGRIATGDAYSYHINRGLTGASGYSTLPSASPESLSTAVGRRIAVPPAGASTSATAQNSNNGGTARQLADNS